MVKADVYNDLDCLRATQHVSAILVGRTPLLRWHPANKRPQECGGKTPHAGNDGTTAGTALSECQTQLRHKEEVKYRMPLRTTDYVDVTTRAQELGIRAPVGIALLPGNFPSAASGAELRYHEATPYVRSAWRSIGLIDGGPDRVRRPASTVGPDAFDPSVPLAVFFGDGLRSGPAGLVTLALGMVASVLTFHPAFAGPREIRLDAVVERPGQGGYACLEYHGDAYELVSLARKVRGIWTDHPAIERDRHDFSLA